MDPQKKKTMKAVLLKPADWAWLETFPGENASQKIEYLIQTLGSKFGALPK